MYPECCGRAKTLLQYLIQLSLIILSYYKEFLHFNDSKYPKIGYFGQFLANFGYPEYCNWAKTSLECVILLYLMIWSYLIEFLNVDDLNQSKMGSFGLYKANFGYPKCCGKAKTLLQYFTQLSLPILSNYMEFLNFNDSKQLKIGYFGRFLANFGYPEYCNWAKT